MNLVLGIETYARFFDGMDAYAKTWLQFVFPAYVDLGWSNNHTWSLLYNSCKIVWQQPHFSFGDTFSIFVYTKLLRTIITTFSLTVLEYPNELELVWIYLIAFFIPLFLTTVLALVLLFIPYTLLLLMGPWIQAHSKRRVFSWINNY